MVADLATLTDASGVNRGFAVGYWRPYPTDGSTPSAASLKPTAAALWTPWPDPWEPAGVTEAGYSLNRTSTLTTLSVEELKDPVITDAGERSFSIDVAFATDTLDVMARVQGATISSASGTDTVAWEDEDIQYWSFGLEMRGSGAKVRQLILPKAIVTPNGATALRRSAALRLYNATISPQGSGYRMFEFTPGA
jgi:hypothetical protein